MEQLCKLGMVALSLLAPTLALAQQPTIKIGSILALTGPAAWLGTSAGEGIRFAVDDVNQAGGLDVKGTKYKVEYIGYDDQFKSAESVSAYGRLTGRDGVKFLFTMFSASHMAVKSLAEADNTFVLTSAISAKAIEADTKNTVRIQALVKDYLPEMVKWMKGNVPGDRIALFYPQDESGLDFSRMSTEAMNKVGYNIVSKELVERTAKDFQPVLLRVMATNPDVIELGPTVASTAGLIVRQARELGYKKAFVMLGGSGVRGIIEAAGADVAEGIIHMVYADPANEAYKPIAARYREKVGQPPNELIVNFYDGAMMLMKAIQVAGDPNDPVKVRAAFPSIFPFKSLQGEMLTFGGKDSIGIDAQVYSTNYIAEVRKGQSVVVGIAK